MSYTVSAGNETAIIAYRAMRLAQDGATLSNDQAFAELLLMGGMDQSVRGWSPIQVKPSGNKFHA